MILYDTKYLQLKSTKSKNGEDWIYAHRPNVFDVVLILPIIEQDKILFQIEERPSLSAENIGKYSIALPAGLVGDERKNETIEEAARAELLEETGLVADSVKVIVRNIASSPGCVSETFCIAKAYVNKYELHSEPLSDNGVICDRVLVELNEIKQWLNNMSKKGFLLTAQTLTSLFYLYDEKGEI